MNSQSIPHDICQELIAMAADALSLDPTVLEEVIELLPEFHTVDVLEAAESLGTHSAATIRAMLEGDKAIDAWREDLDEVG